jgi:hypothetical protein
MVGGAASAPRAVRVGAAQHPNEILWQRPWISDRNRLAADAHSDCRRDVYPFGASVHYGDSTVLFVATGVVPFMAFSYSARLMMLDNFSPTGERQSIFWHFLVVPKRNSESMEVRI